ncbi:DNA-directed RNA polymerase subunit alpha [Chloroflexota bacterium]
MEKGIGITLGNALRRMLLGYLPGAAVTWVKVEGIQHEFSTVPHMKEDMMELLLNVKALRLRAVSGRSGSLALEVEGEGQVHAADIKPSDDFEIVNPQLHIATLDSPDARLNIEFNVEINEGYREADSTDALTLGAIPVDAIFTPVRKVNYTIEPLHIGQETSKERLCLDVWTDSTISPLDATSQSASMLVELLSPLIDYARISKLGVLEEPVHPSVPYEKYNINIEELDLSVRTLNALKRAGIRTVGELVLKAEKELLQLRNFGQKSKLEVVNKLQSMGLNLVSLVGQDEEEVNESQSEGLDEEETPEAEDTQTEEQNENQSKE